MNGMKKASSKKSTIACNGSAVSAVDAYLAAVPEPARSTLEKLRSIIRTAAPTEATETLYYGMPAFRYKGALVCYAAFKNHCSFYPLNGSLIERFAEELKAYSTSKGTIQFSMDKCVPAALVKKLVKARVAENERKKG